MKRIAYFLTITVFIIGITNCNEENSPIATTTTSSSSTTSSCCPFATLSGVGSLPYGVIGDIQNTRVALYISPEDWNLDITYAFTACDASGNYTMGQLVPGMFYMDAWKDNDNDGEWGSTGDYVWVYGSGVYPNYTLDTVKIPGFQITSIDFELFVVP
ncbi:MAG: hypothetical protein HKM87_02835 [Ignavibacteriaceae bacterium]|nr:hypothetical protein [Ignavibacteriaceae bacterium]